MNRSSFYKTPVYFTYCLLLTVLILSSTHVLTAAPAAGTASEDDPVLVTMDGKPAIYKSMLIEYAKKEFPDMPQEAFQGATIWGEWYILSLSLLEKMALNKLIQQYLNEHKLDTSEKYKENLRNARAAIGKEDKEDESPKTDEQALAKAMFKTFADSLTKDSRIPTNELKRAYSKKKWYIPGIVKSQKGRRTIVVSFDLGTSANAEAFLKKARTTKNAEEFKKLAIQEKLELRLHDCGIYTPSVSPCLYNVEPELQNQFWNLKHKVGAQLKTTEKASYVVYTGPEEDETYHTFAESSEAVKKFLQKEHRYENVNKKLRELWKQHRVTIKTPHGDVTETQGL